MTDDPHNGRALTVDAFTILFTTIGAALVVFIVIAGFVTGTPFTATGIAVTAVGVTLAALSRRHESPLARDIGIALGLLGLGLAAASLWAEPLLSA